MAYSSASGPYGLVQAVAGGLISTSTAVTPGFANIYAYRTTDGSATWGAANYFTDAQTRGIKKFDMVFVLSTGSTAYTVTMGLFTAISTGSTTMGYGTANVIGWSTA